MMFIIGMLIMWFILGGLIYLNDSFSFGWGVELFDGWLGIVVCFPWLVILCPLIIIKSIFKKMLKKSKRH